jgi:hypothetical protein
MKTFQKSIFAALLAAGLIGGAQSGHGAITGQWNFKSANLSATIGQDMQYLDADTQAGTQFGTTTSFGLPNLGGQATNVMKFPQASSEFGGFSVPVGAAPNGGGSYVNQYTVVMDVLFPTNSSGHIRALFVTDNGGEFNADTANAIGFVGGFTVGSLTPNAWHRVAFAVDTTNTTALFIDGAKVGEQPTPGGLDGSFAITSAISLFDDANTNSQAGYLASLQFQDQKLPDGLIEALGGPTAAGILTGPPPNPYVVSEAPTSDLRFPGRSGVPPNPNIQIVLADGVTTVNTNTIQLKFNDQTVTPSVTRSGSTTTVMYSVTNFLAALTTNTVALAYQDSGANPLGVQYAFVVGNFTTLPAAAADPAGSATTRGFIFRVVQAPDTDQNDIDNIFNTYTRAIQQLDGTLLDTNGVAFTNSAVLGPNRDGSYFIDVVNPNDVICFTLDGSPLTQFPNFPAVTWPGIPSTDPITGQPNNDNFADETLTYLALNAGSYTFGVDVAIDRTDYGFGGDDGYRLYCGTNPRDQFATLVGQFLRTGDNFNDRQNTNEFTFVVPVTGVYPFRLVHWQNFSGANLAWYSVDAATGAHILINDPTDARSIKAYRVSNIPREPYLAEVSPAPGAAGVAASAPITVVLGDDDLAVKQGSIQLSLNGTKVAPTTAKNGKFTTLSYNPNATRSAVTNDVHLVYADANGQSFTNDWSFTIVTTGSAQAAVTAQWDFNNGDLSATVGKDLKYLDGPGAVSQANTVFGTTTSLGIADINGTPAKIMKRKGAVNSAIGYIADHGISPNGGGQLVNQYTFIMDVYFTGTMSLFNCQNTNNTTDGSIFWQGNQLGQGTGGYNGKGTATANAWHRIALAADMGATPSVITKFVDGIKQEDWIQPGLDLPRRSWQHTILLLADGDGDDQADTYVSSIQIRNGKLSDAQLVALGGPSAGKIPQVIPATSVTGQWDFQSGDLSATIGKDLQYFDGTNGLSATKTVFDWTTNLSIADINGTPAKVMKVPGDISSSIAYIMDHQIPPNGGGQLVNVYTIIMDAYFTGTMSLFNCQNTNNTTDGSIFWQGNQLGQGTGGYNGLGTATANAWHRIALAADMGAHPPVITKFVDGIKQEDWVQSGLDLPRRSWQHTVLLFADGDGDDRATTYVRSIQVSSTKLSDAQLVALGGPSADGIPVAVASATTQPVSITITVSGSNVTLTWPTAGYTLQSTPTLSSPAWQSVAGANNTQTSFTTTLGTGSQFFRLAQ